MKGVFGSILGIILILFGISTFYLLAIQKPTRGWLVRGDHVIGSSITHRGVPYTLGFYEQNRMIGLLNNSNSVEEDEQLLPAKESIVDRITLYFTDESPLVFVPLKDDLSLFSISRGEPGTFLEVGKPGRLCSLLKTTYDNGY